MAGGKGIILLGQNLFFLGRVEAVAAPRGFRVRQAHTAADFWAAYDDGAGDTGLVLVDLEGDAGAWAAVLSGLQQRAQSGAGARPALRPTPRIVAFGPHEDAAAMTRARALGCCQTLNKGRFSATLGEIVGGGG